MFYENDSLEIKLNEAISKSDYIWKIESVHETSPAFKVLRYLKPDEEKRSLELTPENARLTRIESVDLAIYILEYYELKYKEKKAIEMMKAYKEEVKNVPL